MQIGFSLADIQNAARWMIDHAGEHKVIAFHGEMGAGKTTFIHAICDLLGVRDHVTSPTFSIINEYHGTGQVIYHLDLYRLKDEAEAIHAGVEDCLYSGHLCLVEWPGKAPALFPADTVHVYLEPTGTNTRSLAIK
jgi:tRNA threonylcarbamoyladenosine biosynthesis protein TsaE